MRDARRRGATVTPQTDLRRPMTLSFFHSLAAARPTSVSLGLLEREPRKGAGKICVLMHSLLYNRDHREHRKRDSPGKSFLHRTVEGRALFPSPMDGGSRKWKRHATSSSSSCVGCGGDDTKPIRFPVRQTAKGAMHL